MQSVNPNTPKSTLISIIGQKYLFAILNLPPASTSHIVSFAQDLYRVQGRQAGASAETRFVAWVGRNLRSIVLVYEEGQRPAEMPHDAGREKFLRSNLIWRTPNSDSGQAVRRSMICCAWGAASREAVTEGGMLLAVSLDIANSFNTMPFSYVRFGTPVSRRHSSIRERGVKHKALSSL